MRRYSSGLARHRLGYRQGGKDDREAIGHLLKKHEAEFPVRDVVLVGGNEDEGSFERALAAFEVALADPLLVATAAIFDRDARFDAPDRWPAVRERLRNGGFRDR